ncbi:MAG: peptidase [Alphaproteobacteria bacterium]|nr:peptidase [Alphaproteobacteria bacterium]
MTRFLSLLIALPLLCASPALAKPAPAPAPTNAGAAPNAAAEFSAERFRGHVMFLADDLLEGRDTGSRGHAIAAAYVASQFESLGLEPAGEQGSWYQWVPLRTSLLAAQKPVITVSGPGGDRSFENGTDVLIGPSAFDKVQDFSAPLVYAGYGIDAPDSGIDDYRGLEVRGKIVVVLAGSPSGISSETAAYFSDQKAVMAAKRGAIAMILLTTEESEKVAPWAVRVGYLGTPRITWLAKNGQPLNDAPGLRATATINGPAAEALFAGTGKTYAALRAEAARGGRPAGFPLRTRMRIQRSSVWTDVTSPEVIAALPGSDPKLKHEVVILMGHLDHLGIKRAAATPASRPASSANADKEDLIFNGALDNAAGVATMIEAARAFVEAGERPRRTILFIANTAEEKGLLGADYFAHYPTVPLASIAAVVDLDMPLLLYDFTDVIAFGAEHSTVAQAVDKAARSMGISLSPDPMPEENIFLRSDHYMFVKQGVPAIMLATGFANGGEAKWHHYLGNVYHSVGDDLSQPINWQAGAKYARLNYLISRYLADADERPRWYQGDYFGDLYAPHAPRAPKPAK